MNDVPRKRRGGGHGGSSLPVVRLKSERKYVHPLIFQKMVERPGERIVPGSLVEVHGVDGEFIGRGMLNMQAPMAIRLLSEKPDEVIDAHWLAEKVADAVRLRRDIYRLDAVTDSYRVIHAEGDGLSGLIVDRFGDVLVVCFYSAGMWRLQHWVFDALLTQFPDAQIFAFGDDNAQKQEGFDCPPGRAPHGGKPVTINEHDAKFFVQIGGKHKTGFFCDQRDNRKRWGELIAATRSSSMLDLCCNSGGFAVYSGLNGATDITGVDLDEEAVDFATRNLRLNNVKAKVTQADIFPWLREAQEAGKRWDAVVLDPAKMTRSRDEVIDALKKYLDMNKLALGVVKPGGLFLTCSCTGVVSEEQFLDMLRRAAFYAGREVQVLEVRGAGPDHPWLAHVNESRYLKAVFCRVL
ncbi:class I SAM-dependent rRNA methyltransferase [Casimicrobium huifangae]|uniref:class I SAM-dependent rRNA methyltransferase n=1 Tax=Casimicrobium huifangae TaxID=2591109 RepID=UPI0012EC7872|nr:class I SAM-dependent rRNA methyltransferase [Casimicrobium huifangae]